MEVTPTPPEPEVVTALMGLLAKFFAAFAAVILAGMSYVWSVARSAKRCAFDAKLKVEVADASARATDQAIRDLRGDIATGFKGVHERLDRHLDQ